MRTSAAFLSFISLLGFGVQQISAAYGPRSWNIPASSLSCKEEPPPGYEDDYNALMSALPSQPSPLIPAGKGDSRAGWDYAYHCKSAALFIGPGLYDGLKHFEPYYADLASLVVSSILKRCFEKIDILLSMLRFRLPSTRLSSPGSIVTANVQVGSSILSLRLRTSSFHCSLLPPR